MNPMIWVIDDDASIRFVFDKALGVNSITHRLFENGEDALAALEHETPDVIISDIRMPGIDGLTLIHRVHEVDENIPFIIITAHSDLTAAIESYESGSFEYLPKPFDIEQAVSVVRRAAMHRVNMLKKKNSLEGTGEDSEPAENAEIIGKSPAMQEVFKFIGRVAHTDVPVLINGEVGTGRELVARAIHNHSSRAAHEFVALDMSSLPGDNVEGEIFGGPGASSLAPAMQKAAGGTLFINEIGDLPYEAQVRLLQFLQRGEYTASGATAPVSADIRVIAATSHNLQELAASGRFISDLYYRLNVINIHMPPLRDRNNDIPMLAKHFLSEAALENHTDPKKLTSEVLIFLCRQNWPGNVRQLKNLCRYLTIMVTGRDIQLVDLPSEFLQSQGTAPATTLSVNGNGNAHQTWQGLLREWVDSRLRAGEQDILSEALPSFERVMLEAALEFTGNHKQESAKLLGWGRNTLTRKIKELNIS